ncbi:protein kinase [Nonomuraea sp. NPDC050643]|uniref:serine/threonine-protein kinase n=1 Tax=Nonomuraea sp. NPDC050643 TaxID=3155660 RepID=UPI0033D3893B
MAQPLRPDDPASLGGYRLAGRLGEGGQGVVYLAHAADGEPVAIKLLSTGDQQTRARLARELDALESVASFCTARVIDVSTDGPRPFVVSEYVHGPSLADRVRERGPLRGGDLERLLVGTATALAAIHAAGIVHRDFKPANVLLGPDGPRVVDFGIARAEGPATMTSGLIGTPAYLAPEQINGSPAAPASDVFAWAASMVYAATGTSPFGADTVPAVLHRVLHAEPDLSPLPPRLREVLASCLVKDPARRPTAQHLMLSLVGPKTSPGTAAPAPGTPSPAGPFPQGSGAGSGAHGRPGAAPFPQGPWSRDGGPTGPQVPAETTSGTAGAGRRRGALIGAVVAVVVALGAAGGTALVLANRPATDVERSPSATGTPDTTQAPDTTQGTPPASETPTAPESDDEETSGEQTPTDDADPGLKIPATFEGDWSGHTTSNNPLDPDGAENEVKLKTGESTALWSEKDQDDDCKGTIALTKVEDTRLTFSLGANEGGCIAGTITLKLEGDDLTYTWQDVPGPGLVTQTGVLNKN